MRANIIFLIFFGLLSGNLYAQSRYKVASIDTFPNFKCYLIQVAKAGLFSHKKSVLISEFSSPSDDSSENSIEISKGMKLTLNLKEVDKKNNPFLGIIENGRRGNSPLYIDGIKIYDPKNPLVVSTCVKGLYLIKNCK